MHKSVLINSVNKNILSSLKQLKLDSIVLDFNSLNSENISSLRKFSGAPEMFVQIPIFQGSKELLQRYPDAKAVEAENKETVTDDYVGICPTHPQVREDALNKVKKALNENIQGIWLNHLRYPTNWNVPEPEILNTCYCDRCLRMFEEYIGESIVGNSLEDKFLHIDGSYYLEWLEFKAEQIVSMIRRVKGIIAESGKEIKVGIFIVPWEDKDYGAGVQRILAQDYSKLGGYIDVFCPELYYKDCGQDVSWVKNKVEYFWNISHPFISIVKSNNVPSKEFKQSLEYATSGFSEGVVVSNLEDLVDNGKKIKVLRIFFDS